MTTASQRTGGHGQSRSAGIPRRAVAVVVAVAVTLVLAFVFIPGPLAARMSGGGFGDRRDLTDALSASFVGYWSSGDRNFPRTEGGWADGLGTGRRAALATAGAAVTALALVSSVAVMANIQGAAAPFSSLLSILPLHSSHGELAGSLRQIRQHLADYPHAGHRTPPAIEVMVSDFGLYHVVIAVAAATVAIVLMGMSVMSWRRFARTGAPARRTRRVLRSFGLLWVLLSLTFIVLVVANVSVAADPAPTPLAFFKGGW